MPDLNVDTTTTTTTRQMPTTTREQLEAIGEAILEYEDEDQYSNAMFNRMCKGDDVMRFAENAAIVHQVEHDLLYIAFYPEQD